MSCRPLAWRMRPKRVSASLAMNKIRKIYEWEGCSESSETFKRVAAQLDSEFKRQRLYMSSTEREDDEVYGVDDTCESDEDASDYVDAMCETDEDEYHSAEDEDESAEDDDESVGDEDESAEDTRAHTEALYPSDEDAAMQPDEPTDRAQSGILEPAGPCDET